MVVRPLIKGIYHLTEGGNGLHSYAGIGNDYLMDENMLLQKLILKLKGVIAMLYFLVRM